MLDAAASVRRHHDQIDRLLFGVVDEFLNRMADHGKGEDFIRIAELVLLDARELLFRLLEHRGFARQLAALLGAGRQRQRDEMCDAAR